MAKSGELLKFHRRGFLSSLIAQSSRIHDVSCRSRVQHSQEQRLGRADPLPLFKPDWEQPRANRQKGGAPDTSEYHLALGSLPHKTRVVALDETAPTLGDRISRAGFDQLTRRLGLPGGITFAQWKNKRTERGYQVYALCLSENRRDKDCAIRKKHEDRLLKDLERLATRVSKGGLKQRDLIHQAIGRLRERYPRVARYYRLEYDPEQAQLVWEEDRARKARAVQLDGAYLLKTDRQDLSAEAIGRIYSLLTGVEAAFRTLKSPLMERPIFHQLERPTPLFYV